MTNFEKQHIKIHEDAVKFWSGVPWHLTNQEIEKLTKKDYTTIAKSRKIYATHTLGVRKSWKPKVESLIAGESSYIVAERFTEQNAPRVSARKLGYSLTGKHSDKIIQLKLA